jgi:cell division control protein 45
MVCISLNQYGDAYSKILAAHRRSPLTAASSVIVLVAPDVDALCAARMLADLFKQDDVIYRIIPVAGLDSLEQIRNEMATYTDVSVLFVPGKDSLDGRVPASYPHHDQYGWYH